MNARDHALIELDRTALPGWRRNLIKQKPQPPTDPRDIALAEQIRIGVVKNHALLDFLIDHYSEHPSRIDPLTRKILAIGLYQLRFLSRIPASAVVDQAVEQARSFGRSRAAAFVNAMLRAALREPDVELPDKDKDPKEYAQVVLSHPTELVTRLFDLLGPQNAIAFCEHDNREPPTLVRLFNGISLDRLKTDGVTITPHEHPGIFVVESAKRWTFAKWASEGLAQVQDATSAGVIEHLDVQSGQDVLDRCAGLGTKTIQIGDRVGSRSWVMAVDPSEHRCEVLRRLLEERRIGNIAVVQASMLRQIPEIRKPAFDRILVDAPCSNSGVLARRPEARYGQSPQTLKSLALLQDQILDDTSEYLHPGGLLVYSTCSVWPEENQQRAESFLERHPDYQLAESQMVWPTFDSEPKRYHDGGFFAVLKRANQR